MEELNNDLENNNFGNYENDYDDDSLEDSDDECTYARFDFESFDLDEFLRRLESPTTSRKRSLFEAPEFVQRLNAFEEVRAGSTVVFECKWKGCPKPSVKWYKDDEEITENPRYSIAEENDGSLKLTIEGACKEDEGAYKVKAENSEGVSSSTGYLSVTGDVSDRTLAAQARKNLDHSVSFPPHLRTIVEQKSLEEREAEELSNLPPSPIQGYIDSFRRGKLGPLFPGCTVPSYADDEGESIDEDDSDSDTSVKSQTYDEELFITEDDDITACEVSDPLLPVREKPLAASIDYSEIIQSPIDENLSSEELTRTEITPIEAQNLYFTSEIQDVDLTTESCDHRLAEHFDEFMKSKRKEVDEIVSYSGQECAVQIPSSSSFGYDEKPTTSVTVQSNFETIISDVPTKLPDIIQTVSYGNLKDIDTESPPDIEDKYLSTAFMHVPNYEPESGTLGLLDDEILTSNTGTSFSEIDTQPTTCVLHEAKNTNEQPRITYDLPWLCYLGLASGSTFLASCTNMSPFYYVLLWVAISFFSFQFCANEERVRVPNI